MFYSMLHIYEYYQLKFCSGRLKWWHFKVQIYKIVTKFTGEKKKTKREQKIQFHTTRQRQTLTTSNEECQKSLWKLYRNPFDKYRGQRRTNLLHMITMPHLILYFYAWFIDCGILFLQCSLPCSLSVSTSS